MNIIWISYAAKCLSNPPGKAPNRLARYFNLPLLISVLGLANSIGRGSAAPLLSGFKLRQVVSTTNTIPEGAGTFVSFTSAVIDADSVAFLARGSNEQE